ncbi:acyl-CoA dehydrogenase family protein [bacterium]|nr:acyl-CoA dehydrogenase family protein [bacterium]
MSHQSVINEIEFLFRDVLNVNVLTHAEGFSQHKPEDFIEAIRQCIDFAEKNLRDIPPLDDITKFQNLVNVPPEFQQAWKKFRNSDVLKSLLPQKFGGKNYPKAVEAAIWEIIAAANPSFYIYLMLTLETAHLINRFGSDIQKDKYCQQLFNCEWTGTLSYTESQADCEWDSVETIARKKDDYYLLDGEKSLIAAGSHDLTNNIIHLILARLDSAGDEDKSLAWFVVPKVIEEKGKELSNNIAIEVFHETIGLQGVPFCTMSFGKSGPTKGFLLCKIGTGENDFYRILTGVRYQMMLQSVALSSQVFRHTIKFACTENRGLKSSDKSKKAVKTISLVSYPHVADNIMYMKSTSEGVRAAVYSIAFFDDCHAHGGKEQKEFFSDLKDLYTGVLKVYATVTGLKSIRKGIQVFGKESFTKEFVTDSNYRNLQATTLFGGANEIVAQEFLERLIHFKDGSLIDTLIKQFSSVDVHQAKTEAMIEAIGVWQDYIGGVIVLVDDLKNDAGSSNRNEEIDPRLSSLWAGRVVQLVGDVIICYHLICLGLAAEKKLEALGVNFFNLQQEVSQDPELIEWYNRLISAEYFALNVLSENEGNIRIIQRRASSALDAMFLSDDHDT